MHTPVVNAPLPRDAALESPPSVQDASPSDATLEEMARSQKTDKTRQSLGELKPEKGVAFEVETRPVLIALSKALGSLIRAIPVPITGPRELERALNIDYMLAWRAYTVATATDAGAIARAVPRSAPMERLLKAAARRRIPSSTIAGVRKAYSAFEEVVQRHAGEGPKRGRGGGLRVGGRGAFDALVGSVHPSAARNLDLASRRAGFKANSYEWGVQTGAHVMTTIYHRGAKPPMVDGVTVTAFIGVHATRKNAKIRLMQRLGSFSAADPAAAVKPTLAYGESVILEEFSSKPLPRMEPTTNTLGMQETNLVFEEIGKAASVNVFLANTTRDMYKSQPQPSFGSMLGISIPREVTFVDVLVPVGWCDSGTVRASRHGHINMYEGVPQRIPEFELPMSETAVHLGTDLGVLDIPEVPRYPEVVRHVLEELGWSQTVFDVFRLRVPYPTMHTWVHLRVDALQK